VRTLTCTSFWATGVVAAFVAPAVGCGGKAAPPMTQSSEYIAGFNPPAVMPGYTRYVMPAVKAIAPGTDAMWCQWIAPPATEDIDVLSLMGAQSKGGHHAIMYATSAAAPVGTTRACADADLASVRYLGAIGGEGVSGVGALPPGVVYRLPAGWSLMANVHYINATEAPIDGQAVLDIQTAPKDPSRVVASLFTNIDIDIALPPNQASALDVNCTIPATQADLHFFFYGNHMHELGKSIFTEVIHPDGTKQMLREDDTWIREFAFNPNTSRWPLDQPLVLKAGDRVHTQCHWVNDRSTEVDFPSEMCASFGFYIGDGVQLTCIKGNWGT
jgi:hypothetical protein